MRDRGLAAIEDVYRTRGSDFFRLAVASTGDAEAARDAVQDGFARAIRSRRSFRGEGSLEAWIARCVINAAHDARRATAAAARSAAPERQETSSGASSGSDAETAYVREAIRGLPARQRDALFLRFYLDFDYASIAQTLGVEVGTVSATLHAARKSLARALEEVVR